MEILITNDDGYRAKGIRTLAGIMRKFGNVTVIAPKRHQSGMSMAVSLGLQQLAYKKFTSYEASCLFGKELGNGIEWAYLDATPASCVKFGFNTCFLEKKPDVVVSGINHGSNAASASCYSGTLGAAQEAALNDVPAIGVSLDTLNPDADFSAIEKYFPDIFSKIMEDLPARRGIYYNVNFPNIPCEQIKGVRTGIQGKGKWVREFKEWDPSVYVRHGITPELLGMSSHPEDLEPGEELFMMVGDFIDDPENTSESDHHLMAAKYISVVAHNIDTTDYEEVRRLRDNGMDVNF